MNNRRLSYGYTCTDPEHEAQVLEAICEGFTRANVAQMQADPDAFPCCLSCGDIQYVEPENCKIRDWRTNSPVDPNCQHVFGAVQLVRRRKGTCIDLACLLAAIYRLKEQDHAARVIIDFQQDGLGRFVPGQYHAMVMRGDGSIVDPVAKTMNANEVAHPIAVGGGQAYESPCGCGGGR